MSIGVGEEKFMDSCPVELKPYEKAYQISEKRRDEQMWTMGIYTMNAVNVAVGKLLHGKGFKGKYFEEPLFKKAEEDETEITEEYKQKARDELLLQLQLMQTNFELNHE